MTFQDDFLCFLSSLKKSTFDDIKQKLDCVGDKNMVYFFCNLSMNDIMSLDTDTHLSLESVLARLVALESCIVFSAPSMLLMALFSNPESWVKILCDDTLSSCTTIEAEMSEKEANILIKKFFPRQNIEMSKFTSGILGFIFDVYKSVTLSKSKEKIEIFKVSSWMELYDNMKNDMDDYSIVQLLVCLLNKISILPFMSIIEAETLLVPVLGKLVKIDEDGVPVCRIGPCDSILENILHCINTYLKVNEYSGLGFIFKPIVFKLLQQQDITFYKYTCNKKGLPV